MSRDMASLPEVKCIPFLVNSQVAADKNKTIVNIGVSLRFKYMRGNASSFYCKVDKAACTTEAPPGGSLLPSSLKIML